MVRLVQAGIAALQRGQPGEAASLLELAAVQQPSAPEILYLLGVAQLAGGKPHTAQQNLAAALRNGLQSESCYHAYAVALERQNDLAAAEEAYRRACFNPKSSLQSFKTLAGFLQRHRSPAEAGRVWAQIVERAPFDDAARIEWALLLQAERRYAEAVDQLQAIPEERRFGLNVWTHLSAALLHSGRFSEAEAATAAALTQNPADVSASWNLGLACQGQGKMVPALTAFESALRLAPENAKLRWNYALALLQAGRWKEGWAETAIRMAADVTPPLSRRWPVWTGQPLDGKTIYIRSEQGLGDTLQFLRYAYWLHKNGARVELAAQKPLSTLLREQPYLADVHGYDEIPTGIDFQVLLLDLPRLFATEPDSIPAAEPFLNVPGSATQRWERELSGLTRPWIAVNWRGNSRYAWDHFRSTTADTLTPLWCNRKGTWFHLDPGVVPPAPLMNPLPASATIADTAAILQQMDLTITTDTMLAHLAGSLGVRVWTLLSTFTDWRWAGKSAQTSWYPTMRLFRQQQLNDWTPVIEAVDRELLQTTLFS